MKVYHRRKSYILHYLFPLTTKCPRTGSLTYYLQKEIIISKDLIDFPAMASHANVLSFLYVTHDAFYVFSKVRNQNVSVWQYIFSIAFQFLQSYVEIDFSTVYIPLSKDSRNSHSVITSAFSPQGG